MNRRLLLLLSIALLAVSCAVPAAAPRAVRVSEAELAAMAANQVPAYNRRMEMFDVVLGSPALTLLPKENRVRMAISYSLSNPMAAGRKFTGALQLSHALRLDAEENAIRLVDVQVERVDLPALPAAFQAAGNRIGSLIAGGMLHDMVVYRLQPDDVRRAAAVGLKPGAIRVVPGAVELQLDPIAPNAERGRSRR